jgi:hypothetical protein
MLKHPALAPTIFEPMPRVWSPPPKVHVTNSSSLRPRQTRPFAMADSSSSPDFTPIWCRKHARPHRARRGAERAASPPPRLRARSLRRARPSVGSCGLWTDGHAKVFVDPLTSLRDGDGVQATVWGAESGVWGRLRDRVVVLRVPGIRLRWLSRRGIRLRGWEGAGCGEYGVYLDDRDRGWGKNREGLYMCLRR